MGWIQRPSFPPSIANRVRTASDGHQRHPASWTLLFLPLASGPGQTGAAVPWGERAQIPSGTGCPAGTLQPHLSICWPGASGQRGAGLLPSHQLGALGGAGHSRVSHLSGRGQPLLFGTDEPRLKPERLCGVWGWRRRPGAPRRAPSHPLCTALLQYHLHFCRDKQLADGLVTSHHIRAVSPAGPLPLGSLCLLPSGSLLCLSDLAHSCLPLCLCLSAEVFFRFLPVLGLSVSAPLPFCLSGGLPIFTPVSPSGLHLWCVAFSSSLPRFSSQLVGNGDQKENDRHNLQFRVLFLRDTSLFPPQK